MFLCKLPSSIKRYIIPIQTSFGSSCFGFYANDTWNIFRICGHCVFRDAGFVFQELFYYVYTRLSSWWFVGVHLLANSLGHQYGCQAGQRPRQTLIASGGFVLVITFSAVSSELFLSIWLIKLRKALHCTPQKVVWSSAAHGCQMVRHFSPYL